MAERRMFAKSVIGSARFLRMPATARLLYYDLGMQADDDGVVEAFSVMRTTGAMEDDLRVLVSKGFVSVLNDDLVTYIMDWNLNNLIRKDRYHPSVYQKLMIQMGIEIQGKLQGSPEEERPAPPQSQSQENQRLTNGQPMVNPGKERLGKDRLGQSSLGKERGEGASFTPPTLGELQDFCDKKGLAMDCEHFWSYYDTRQWRLSNGEPMSNWKSAAVSWAKRERHFRQPLARATAKTGLRPEKGLTPAEKAEELRRMEENQKWMREFLSQPGWEGTERETGGTSIV